MKENMEMKSSDKIANATASTLQSKCANIGKSKVEAPGNSYIAGIRSATDAFEEINYIHLSYKECLDSDALTIKEIGTAFSKADKDLAGSFQ